MAWHDERRPEGPRREREDSDFDPAAGTSNEISNEISGMVVGASVQARDIKGGVHLHQHGTCACTRLRTRRDPADRAYPRELLFGFGISMSTESPLNRGVSRTWVSIDVAEIV